MKRVKGNTNKDACYRLAIGTMAFIPTFAMAAGKSNHKKPNIVYIMADDLGYGDLGCYGQPYIETPHIDKMAAEGMRFTQAYAGAPVSAPSRADWTAHRTHADTRQ